MSKKISVLILGAGPAGVGAAYKLSLSQRFDVTVIERNSSPGGNAGSFLLNNIPVDYGSHRLHPSTKPEIMQDIRNLLGNDLLKRPRHGRIRLCGRWIHFPLKPFDLLTKLPPVFALGTAMDLAAKPFDKPQSGQKNFVTILQKGLGKTICRDFYFPYAKKLWGRNPEELSAIQAKKRVSAGSVGKLLKKVAGGIFKAGNSNKGIFYYPYHGFGQISQAYYQQAKDRGVNFLFETSLKTIDLQGKKVNRVICQGREGLRDFSPDWVWSTVPVTLFTRAAGSTDNEVVAASNSIQYRSMILIYLVLEKNWYTDFDAHYFPEEKIRISRLSEVKHYHNGNTPAGRTVLCAELPCNMSDPEWSMDDENLATLMHQSLLMAGLPRAEPVVEVLTKRLPQAYPIYLQGFEKHFNVLDQWVSGLENVLSFGRQGLFAHDNTHHALSMAYAASECLNDEGDFDFLKWKKFREEFDSHVVED